MLAPSRHQPAWTLCFRCRIYRCIFFFLIPIWHTPDGTTTDTHHSKSANCPKDKVRLDNILLAYYRIPLTFKLYVVIITKVTFRVDFHIFFLPITGLTRFCFYRNPTMILPRKLHLLGHPPLPHRFCRYY